MQRFKGYSGSRPVRRYIFDGRDHAVCSLASWNVDKNHDSWSCQKVLVTRSSVRSCLLPRLAVAPNLTDDACHQQCCDPRPKRKDPCGKQRSMLSYSHVHATSVTVANGGPFRISLDYQAHQITWSRIVLHGFHLGLPLDFPYCWQAIAT